MFLSLDSRPLPWILPLPRPNRRLSALAARVADCAHPLIVATGTSTLMGVTAEPDGALRITWWNEQMAVYAELTAKKQAWCAAASAEGALQRSGAALLDYLAGRWPPEARPPSLGIVTDGVGIAFSPCHPSPCVAGWLQRHGAGEARPLAILPFAVSGAGMLLAADPFTGTVH